MTKAFGILAAAMSCVAVVADFGIEVVDKPLDGPCSFLMSIDGNGETILGDVCAEVVANNLEVTIDIDGNDCCLKETHICNVPTYTDFSNEDCTRNHVFPMLSIEELYDFACTDDGQMFQVNGHATVACDGNGENPDEEEICYSGIYEFEFNCTEAIDACLPEDAIAPDDAITSEGGTSRRLRECNTKKTCSGWGSSRETVEGHDLPLPALTSTVVEEAKMKAKKAADKDCTCSDSGCKCNCTPVVTKRKPHEYSSGGVKKTTFFVRAHCKAMCNT